MTTVTEQVHQGLTEEQEKAAFLDSVAGHTITGGGDQATLDAALDALLERLRAHETEMTTNRAVAERRVQMIELWLLNANERLEREGRWIRQQIQAVAESYDFGSKKSRELPSGTFGYRTRPPALEIQDMAAAVAFAEAHGLEIKKTVNKTPLLAHFKATGEIPEGTEYVPAEEAFYVKV